MVLLKYIDEKKIYIKIIKHHNLYPICVISVKKKKTFGFNRREFLSI